MNFKLVVPTYNPGHIWQDCVIAIKKQNLQPDDVLVIDSESVDNTVEIAVKAGFKVRVIDKASFNHGGTRQKAVDELTDCDFVVFLTQDALLADTHTLEELLKHFNDKTVAAVCGRQLPRQGAAEIEAHARLFNYPQQSFTRSIHDAQNYGLKTAFISNSFAAYRITALTEVGGFPDDVIFGEDMYIAAKLLKADYIIAYSGDACVYHSHDYTIWQEMKRYFDMGVFHAREEWIRNEFGGAEKEGIKFVQSEIKYLKKHAYWKIPEGLMRTGIRFIGFRLGLLESHIPLKIKRKMSMNPGYFSEN
jgi:rhamnosyltransferase